ncbi:MAG: hypothetical protein KAJ07_04505 [Planctomycetes bacterium]|nr:hypothetical protein [Planctomycetota bacterium]
MQTDKQNNNTQPDQRPTGGKIKWTKNKYEVIFAIVLVVILLVVLFTVKPGRYKPFRSDGSDLVSPYLTHRLAPEFLNNVQLDEPFDMVIEQDGINDIVSRIGWFDDSGKVTVSAPSIVFRRDVFYIMATVKVACVPTVVTIIASPSVDNGMIIFNLRKVKFGSMPMTAVAKKIVRKMVDEQMADVAEDDTQKRFWRALLDNEPFDPSFTVYDSQIKITNATFEKQKLTITIMPIPEE